MFVRVFALKKKAIVYLQTSWRKLARRRDKGEMKRQRGHRKNPTQFIADVIISFLSNLKTGNNGEVFANR